MKKSLAEAIERGLEYSKKFPETTVYVMDKPRQHAAVHTSEWVYREKILAGWHTVKKFLNGQEVK